jgi:hypothetical protein
MSLSHMFTRIGWPGSGRRFSWQASLFCPPDIFSLLVSSLTISSENRWSYTCDVSTLFQCGQWCQSKLRVAARGATLVGGCVDTLMPTCSSLWVAAEPLPGLEPDLLIDEVSHTYMKNLSTNVDDL